MYSIYAVLVVIAAFLLALGLKFLFENKLSRQIRNYKKIFRKIINALVVLFIATGVYFAAIILKINVNFMFGVKIIIVLIGLYILFLLTNYFTDALVHGWHNKINAELKLIHMINLLLKIIITLFVIFIILRVSGLDVFTIAKELFEVIKSNVITWALTIFVGYLIIAGVVLYVFKTYFSIVVKRTNTKIDDILITRIEKPLTWVIILIGGIIALSTTGYGRNYAIPGIKSLIAAVIVYTLIRLTDDMLEEWAQESGGKVTEDIVQITSNFIKIALLVVGLFILLVIWGVEIKSILLSVGIISVVLGFALKGTLDNILSGLSLMLDHAFRVGEVIKLETGEIGEVIHIGLRSTEIKTYDNELLVIPNAVLANMRVVNYAKPDNNVRIVLPVSVEYGSNVEKVKKVLKNCLKSVNGITLPHLIDVWFVKMNDFSMDFSLVFYIDDCRKKRITESRVNSIIYKELKKNKINIPFPTRTVYIKKGEIN